MKKVLYFLGEMSDSDFEWLLSTGHQRLVKVGTVLVQQGEDLDYFYIVLDGELAVIGKSPDTHELARLARGDVVGEISFVDSRPPSATVQAITPATLLAIPRDYLAIKLRSDLEFSVHFYRAIAMFMAHRLRHMNWLLDEGSDGIDPQERGHEFDQDNLYLAGVRFERMLKNFLVSGDATKS